MTEYWPCGNTGPAENVRKNPSLPLQLYDCYIPMSHLVSRSDIADLVTHTSSAVRSQSAS